jgi:hypothetical protein
MAIGSQGCYEGEDSEVVYTLKVYTPPRPVVPQLFDLNKHSNFKFADLATMKTKIVKISCHDFPDTMKCDHVKTTAFACYEGCYVLEKGGSAYMMDENNISQACNHKDRQGHADCQGHAYHGKVVANHGVVCFGEKGNRLVRLSAIDEPQVHLSAFYFPY